MTSRLLARPFAASAVDLAAALVVAAHPVAATGQGVNGRVNRTPTSPRSTGSRTATTATGGRAGPPRRATDRVRQRTRCPGARRRPQGRLRHGRGRLARPTGHVDRRLQRPAVAVPPSVTSSPSPPTAPTTRPGRDLRPGWTRRAPDGAQVAFTLYRGGKDTPHGFRPVGAARGRRGLVARRCEAHFRDERLPPRQLGERLPGRVWSPDGTVNMFPHDDYNVGGGSTRAQIISPDGTGQQYVSDEHNSEHQVDWCSAPLEG